ATAGLPFRQAKPDARWVAVNERAARLRGSLIRESIRSQHASANSRSFRSLTFPRRKSSIGSGAVQASHSSSVIASPSATPPAYSVSGPGVLSHPATAMPPGPSVPRPPETVRGRDAEGEAFIFQQVSFLATPAVVALGRF